MSELLEAIKVIQGYFNASDADEYTITSYRGMVSPELTVKIRGCKQPCVNPEWEADTYESMFVSQHVPTPGVQQEIDEEFNVSIGDKFIIMDLFELEELDSDFLNYLDEEDAVKLTTIDTADTEYQYRLDSNAGNIWVSKRTMQRAISQGYLQRVEEEIKEGDKFSTVTAQEAVEVPKLKTGDMLIMVNPGVCEGDLRIFQCDETIVVRRVDETSIPYRLEGKSSKYFSWIALENFEAAYRAGYIKLADKEEARPKQLVRKLVKGDKIRVVDPSRCTGNLNCFKRGDIGTVVEVDTSSTPYHVRNGHKTYWLSLTSFETAVCSGAAEILDPTTHLDGQVATIDGKEYVLTLT
jgi:hypothetical protein